MSDLPADWRDQLNVREQIARIDRSLDAAAKLRAEQRKLISEGQKFNRDPWILALTALIAAFAVVVARLPELLGALK